MRYRLSNVRTIYILVCFLVLVPLASAVTKCCHGGTCSCYGIGTCTYTCNNGWYHCSSSTDCDSTTPCKQYTFQRFTFNVSNYTSNGIWSITYCFEGYYTGSGSAKLQYYNVTSGSWTDDQNLETSESVKCKTLTGVSDIVNGSNIFQFAVRGYIGASGDVLVYTDNVNLSVTYGLTLNAVNWAQGMSDYALEFADSGPAQANDSASLNITDQLTIEAWVKANSLTTPFQNYQMIVAKGNFSVRNYALYLHSDELFFNWDYGGDQIGADETVDVNLQPNTWYHVAVVFNYSGNSVKLYVDGVEKTGDDPTPSNNLVANDLPLTIGSFLDGILPFNGTIDEVAIYDRAKSADEIYADANPLHISLNMVDSLDSSISIRDASSGYVNPLTNNTFYLKTSGNGNLNVTAGNYSGPYSLRMYVNNAKANLLLKAIQEGVSDMHVILPIQLQIYQQIFSNLAIAEK